MIDVIEGSGHRYLAGVVHKLQSGQWRYHQHVAHGKFGSESEESYPTRKAAIKALNITNQRSII